MGLICVVLIFLWVNDELKMDKFHEKDKQLFRVMHNFHSPNGITTWDITPFLLAETLAEEMPEVETATSISSDDEKPHGIITHEQKTIVADGMFAKDNYFEVFSYPLLVGDARQVLQDKNNIVLSEDLAQKLFPSLEHVIGEKVTWTGQQGEQIFQVSGVFKNLSAHSTQSFDFVWNMNLLLENDEHAIKWNADYAHTFVVLKSGTNPTAFNHRINDLLVTKDKKRNRSQLFIQQYSKKYLYGNFENGQQSGGRIAYVRLLSLCALFILVMACINFMNLSTAQASTKLKEIGVKKTIGAHRKTLIMQFLTESILMAFLALLVALIAVKLILPQFNDLAGKSVVLALEPSFLAILLGIVLITGLASGTYPAFYLSAFKPISILNNKQGQNTGHQWTRRGLVIFQFALALIFMVGVVVIHQQMDYIQTQNLGFNRDNVLTFHRGNNQDSTGVFLTELQKIPGIVQVANMSENILSGNFTQSGYSWRGQEADKKMVFKSPIIAHNVIETLDMELVAGRSYSKNRQEEYNKVIINESAAKLMGFDEPVGKTIAYGRKGERQIIGVVKDFQYGSMHHKIEPLIFRYRERGQDVLVKIKAGTEKVTIAQIDALYQSFHPGYPLEFTFLDDAYQALYELENKVAVLSRYFSLMAILISCLGLFGLTLFIIERRKKEIGIRKILGASVFGLVRMLTSDFAKTVLIGIFLALPLSYCLANVWLEKFAYRIELNIWFFALPAALVLLIAACSIGVQTIRAARLNPVQSLNRE